MPTPAGKSTRYTTVSDPDANLREVETRALEKASRDLSTESKLNHATPCISGKSSLACGWQAMLLNVVSSTSIVILNKIIMGKWGFHFATTLTFVHLLFTFLLLLLSCQLGVFQAKALDLRPVAKLAAGTMGFICLGNLSLQHNSIGFYQIMKVMTTPTVVLIEALVYGKSLDKMLKLTLIPVCLGVVATTTNDFELNPVGSVYAVMGVIVTSFYQIWSGSIQKSLRCNALQLQTYVSPLAATFVLVLVPLFDNYVPGDPGSIWEFKTSPQVIALIVLTGFCGFVVNISIFLVIGAAGPVSYNVLSHVKTVIILLSDFLLFGRPPTLRSSSGIILTLIGVFSYSAVKLNRTSSQGAENESDTVTADKAQQDNSVALKLQNEDESD